MDVQLFKVAHLVGLAALVLGFGAILNSPKDARPKIGMALHGIGLLLLLIAGFGMLPKLKVEVTSTWVLGKIGVWALFAALPFVVNKTFFPRLIGWTLVLALVGGGAWLAIYKPGA